MEPAGALRFWCTRSRSFTAWWSTGRLGRGAARLPDMRIPIAHCLAYPTRIDGPAARLDLARVGTLSFEAPDPIRFPALALGRRRLETGGAAPTILNAANEIAVAAFIGRGNSPLAVCSTGGLLWMRLSAAMRPQNRKISMKRSPLTIWRGRWRKISCPKSPQSHSRKRRGGLRRSGAGTGPYGHFQHFGLWGAGWTGWIIPFLFGLSVVVFFHEMGHFLVARWCGVRVLVFSIGFGPELLGFTDRQGTRWKISAIRSAVM